MKLAIIGQTLNKNLATKISGGIQTVERLHVKIFLEAGWEVYFIAPECSESFSEHPNFHLLRCTLPAQDQCGNMARADKAKHSRTLAKDIQDLIFAIDPDLIINHSFSSAHVRIATEFAAKFPVLNFLHNTPDTAMDIGIIAKVKFYKEMAARGSALICVSGYQRDLWRVALKKRIANGDSFDFITPEDVDKIYDKFCYPVYIDHNEVQDHKEHFVVITRPDPPKNVAKLLELSKGLNYHLHLFMAHPTPLEECEYYVKKIKPHLTDNVTVHLNAPRQELLDCLATAAGSFTPCTVESAGITLLEAASYGVRSIVFGRERDGVLDHAACHLLGKENLELINVSEKDEIAKEQLSKAVRKLLLLADTIFAYSPDLNAALRDEAYSRHSFAQRKKDLLKITEDIMSNYKVPKKPLLGF
jgi:hypothetical protein